MSPLVFIPVLTFVILLAGETLLPRQVSDSRHSGWDWVIHLSGFLIQGAVIPLFGYFIATQLPYWIPQGAGVLPLGWWGAFLLNFVFVDFLYYWQHRGFHQVPLLWKLHLCHHTARRVDVWVTSRNALVFHFLFVYFLLNPILGYLVTRPEGFFAVAMVTASLDIFRHANIGGSRLPGLRHLGPWLGQVFVLPAAHHRHHSATHFEGNYGANLILWDRLFHTFLSEDEYPTMYGVRQAPSLREQWLCPLKGKVESDAS